MEYLVNCGNNIDSRASIIGQAPIHKAVLSPSADEERKNETLCNIIKECNANVNNIDANGWTALHHAAYNGDLASAQTLIENDADVNAFSNQSKTPLHFSAMNNHVDIC